MKKNKFFLIFLISCSINFNGTANMTRPLSEPVIESAMHLALTGGQNLTSLAVNNSPAVVNFGIYKFINKFTKPALIIFGTEAAILLTLHCTQNDPWTCLSSLINIDNVQAVTHVALENLGTGVTYALGEEVAQKALAAARGNSSREMTQIVLTALAATGMGFYAWSMDPSLNQSMLLSLCSGIVLTSLTGASKQTALKNIQQKIGNSLSTVSSKLGKIIGVATIAAGSAAIAYQTNASDALLGAVINATNSVVQPEALTSMQSMIRANYTWIEGYRWTKNIFKKWS